MIWDWVAIEMSRSRRRLIELINKTRQIIEFRNGKVGKVYQAALENLTFAVVGPVAFVESSSMGLCPH